MLAAGADSDLRRRPRGLDPEPRATGPTPGRQAAERVWMTLIAAIFRLLRASRALAPRLAKRMNETSTRPAPQARVKPSRVRFFGER